MKYLSRDNLEEIADKIVCAYKKLPQLSGQKIYRIDPIILCEQLLKLKIEYWHLSLDRSILGLTSFCEIGVEVFERDNSGAFYFLDGKTLLIESDLKARGSKGRHNFTIAHEAGHQICKMLYPNEYGAKPQNKLHFYKPSTSSKKSSAADWEEWQANTLASAILLPAQLIGQAMYIFGFGDKIHSLNRVFSPDIYERFSGMADFLGCSRSALAIRMKKLGLLEQEYLENPYGILDVEV